MKARLPRLPHLERFIVVPLKERAAEHQKSDNVGNYIKGGSRPHQRRGRRAGKARASGGGEGRGALMGRVRHTWDG